MRKIITGFELWSEIELLTGMIYGEARGEITAGKIGVALTAKTRADNPSWWGKNWREVILADKQFSCWADHNADQIRVARKNYDTAWTECRKVAEDVYLGRIVDNLGGPTHYHSVSCHPDWVGGMKRLAQLGNHIFYRDL